MTKKLTVFFAVLTAICVVAAVPLIPFAIRDTSNMIVSAIDELDDMEIHENFSIQDHESKLDIKTGNLHTPYISITHNDAKSVIVRSDSLGFMHIDPMVINSGDTVTIDLNFRNNESYPFPDSQQEIKYSLARMVAEKEYSSIEICVPDGLVLTMDGRDLDPDDVYVAADVRYLTKDALTEPNIDVEPTVPEVDPVQSFESRVQELRKTMMSLVRDNAQDSYDQLDFNMHLNDCRIQLESLLMEYAKENDLINYDKYKDQQSSTATGISGISSGVVLTPYDSSLSESEARNLIHELSGLYLSRLTVQAKLENTVYELVGNEDDADLLEAQLDYEAQIERYTAAISSLEDMHTDFIMELMNTGLLF